MNLDLVIMALGGDAIQISNFTAHSSTTAPTASAAVYRLETDGDIGATQGSNTVVDAGNWISPQGAASDFYEARATVTSGSLSSGTAGSWLGLGTQRSWSTLSASGTGFTTCTFTLEIRRASDSVVVDTATITLQADSSA